MSDVVAFKMGWGSHFVHHIRANEHRYWYVKRHPDLPIRNRLNVPDCPEAVHMLSDTAKAIGVPRLYDYGPQREGWFGQLVTNWMGDAGFLKRITGQYRSHVYLSDVVRLGGTAEVAGDRLSFRKNGEYRVVHPPSCLGLADVN